MISKAIQQRQGVWCAMQAGRTLARSNQLLQMQVMRSMCGMSTHQQQFMMDVHAQDIVQDLQIEEKSDWLDIESLEEDEVATPSY